MTKIVFLFYSLLFIIQQAYSQRFEIKSPDERLQVVVNITDKITCLSYYDNNVVIENIELGMDFSSGPDFGVNPQVKKHSITKESNMIYPAVPNKDAEIKDEFVQLTLTFKEKYQLNFRAYNDGMAYQFIDKGKSKRNVMTEKLDMTFPEGSSSLFPKEKSMYSHNERSYLDRALNELSANDFCSLPVLFITENAKVLFTETALYNYPGMFIKGNSNTTMQAIFPKFILDIKDSEKRPDRNQTKPFSRKQTILQK